MQELRHRIKLLSGANAPLMLYGESGTGKDLVARFVHQHSQVSNGPFVKVSCPAIPGTLLESELFGYEKGAFTGANTAKPGRVEMADTGTLFLDEVTEMDLALQPKLLQLLQDGHFSRIGGFEDRSVHIRLICASNRDLLEEVSAGRFREDLYFRINVLSFRMPPLRERADDIPLLIDYFLKTFNRSFNRTAPPISSTLMRILQAYHWPGNIRELENLVKRYIILGTEEAITSELRSPDELPFNIDIPQTGESIALKELTKGAVARLERSIILRVLQAHHWNRRKAAAALKISYRSLLYKLKEVGVPPSRGIYAVAKNGNNPSVKEDLPKASEPSLDPLQHSNAKVSRLGK